MRIYCIYGKRPVSRFGVDNLYINIRIIYLPGRELKFIVDDREIRKLSPNEDSALLRSIRSMEETGTSEARYNLGKSRISLPIRRGNIGQPFVDEIEKILSSYELGVSNQDETQQEECRKYFFINPNLQKFCKVKKAARKKRSKK